VPEATAYESKFYFNALTHPISPYRDFLVTHPPDPLPLQREGGSRVREGRSPSLKTLSPSPRVERGTKGVRLTNYLKYYPPTTSLELKEKA